MGLTAYLSQAILERNPVHRPLDWDHSLCYSLAEHQALDPALLTSHRILEPSCHAIGGEKVARCVTPPIFVDCHYHGLFVGCLGGHAEHHLVCSSFRNDQAVSAGFGGEAERIDYLMVPIVYSVGFLDWRGPSLGACI